MHPPHGTLMLKVDIRQDLYSPLQVHAKQLCIGAIPQPSSKWTQRLRGLPPQLGLIVQLLEGG